MSGGMAVISECQFSANPGGALLVVNGTLNVDSTNFIGNGELGTLSGGAAKVEGGLLDVQLSLFSHNEGLEGGAIFATGGEVRAPIVHGCDQHRGNAHQPHVSDGLFACYPSFGRQSFGRAC